MIQDTAQVLNVASFCVCSDRIGPACYCSMWQEFWDNAVQSQWSFEKSYVQSYRLFDVMVSTKEVLEDCFGYLSHRARIDNRNPLFMTAERLYFHASLSPRWIDQAWPRVMLQQGDLRSPEALSYSRGKDAFLPNKHNRSSTYQAVKQVVDAGGL